MHSANIPPPPSYVDATRSGFGNQYNTQYSSPLQQPGTFQPPQPPPYGQSTFNQAYGGPGVSQQPFGQPTFNQAYGGPGVPQHPMAIAPPTQQVVTGLSRPRFLQLQRLAIMATICCFPVGIFAWYEFKKATAAFDRGSQAEGERHVASCRRYAFVSLAFGFLVVAVVIINPFRFMDWSSDHEREGNEDEP